MVEGSESFILKIPGFGSKVYENSEDITQYLFSQYGLQDFWLDQRPDSKIVSVRLRLRGGKGGFGSNLRAQGNKMSKKRAGNESCRDLSGRRIRSTNHAKLVSEYLVRKPEMERRREKEIREKMLKAIEAPNRRPVFSDVDYLRTARETVDMVEAAVLEAMLGGESDCESEDDSKGKEKIGRTTDDKEAGPSVQH
jgi:hypothetical protein